MGGVGAGSERGGGGRERGGEEKEEGRGEEEENGRGEEGVEEKGGYFILAASLTVSEFSMVRSWS